MKALRCAFPHTIPIFAGFWFLGLTYGVYMNVSGFSFWYPMLMSLTIFAGSVEFVAVSLLPGIGLSLLCLVLFGADSFIIPAMCAILLSLTGLRGRLEQGGEPA